MTKRALGAGVLAAAILAGGAANAAAADFVWLTTGPNSGVNVRATADMHAPILAQLGPNQEILAGGVVTGGAYPAVCGADGHARWREVNWNGRIGYVALPCLFAPTAR